MNALPEFLADGNMSYLYNVLWKSCAGPLFDLPKYGEKVYYFPQGHLEHLESTVNDDLGQMQPIFDLPSKLKCNVVDIQLKVEKDTDEVYAQITLLPNTTENEIPNRNDNQERQNFQCFTKVLSVSDTSTHGGLSIMKRHAIECLPPLDMSQPTPTQEIIAKDLHGYEWKFKHIFRGTPQRHLFTTGWNAFATSKRLVAGDAFVFLRGENGESRVGIRRAVHQQGNLCSSIISKESMHNGVIASALNAFHTKSMFIVFSKPRSSQFIVRSNKFINAVNNKFNVGSRFTMRFESVDFTEIRYTGTIIGVKDFSPHWNNSEWRSLEVQWDEDASIPRPNMVSPWEIEHIAHSSNVLQSDLFKNKRACQVNETSKVTFNFGSNLWTPTLTPGQEIGQSSKGSPMNIPQLSYGDAADNLKIPSGWEVSYSVPTITKPKYNEEMAMSMKEKATTYATTGYRLFGVDLMIPTEAKNLIGPIDQSQSKQINSARTRTKVQMEGIAIGRCVDLTVLDGYNQLIEELEKLFELNGELRTRNQWEIVFTDNEGDMMLVGDDPWPDFCNMVKKIVICPKENVKIMKSGKKD